MFLNSYGINSYYKSMNSYYNFLKSSEKLSSGLRINRASDDISGLTISEKLRSTSRGFAQSQRNIMDGISMVKTADGGLSGISDTLIKMKELSIQASSGSYNSDNLQIINNEFNQLKETINTISKSNKFNSINLLNSNDTVKIQIGNSSSDKIDIKLSEVNSNTLNLNSLSLSTSHDASNALSAIDESIKQVNKVRAEFGAKQNALEHTYENITENYINTMASESRIRDLNYAKEMINYTSFKILQHSSYAVMLMNAEKLQSNNLFLLQMNYNYENFGRKRT